MKHRFAGLKLCSPTNQSHKSHPCRDVAAWWLNMFQAPKIDWLNSRFTHWKWWFSIVMLVYQRVSIWLVVQFHHLEKWWSSSLGRMTPHIWWKNKIHVWIIWLVVYLPLWKIWVRQLGWWHSHYIYIYIYMYVCMHACMYVCMYEQSKFMFQTTKDFSVSRESHPEHGWPWKNYQTTNKIKSIHPHPCSLRMECGEQYEQNCQQPVWGRKIVDFNFLWLIGIPGIKSCPG